MLVLFVLFYSNEEFDQFQSCACDVQYGVWDDDCCCDQNDHTGQSGECLPEEVNSKTVTICDTKSRISKSRKATISDYGELKCYSDKISPSSKDMFKEIDLETFGVLSLKDVSPTMENRFIGNAPTEFYKYGDVIKVKVNNSNVPASGGNVYSPVPLHALGGWMSSVCSALIPIRYGYSFSAKRCKVTTGMFNFIGAGTFFPEFFRNVPAGAVADTFVLSGSSDEYQIDQFSLDRTTGTNADYIFKFNSIDGPAGGVLFVASHNTGGGSYQVFSFAAVFGGDALAPNGYAPGFQIVAQENDHNDCKGIVFGKNNIEFNGRNNLSNCHFQKARGQFLNLGTIGVTFRNHSNTDQNPPKKRQVLTFVSSSYGTETTETFILVSATLDIYDSESQYDSFETKFIFLNSDNSGVAQFKRPNYKEMNSGDVFGFLFEETKKFTTSILLLILIGAILCYIILEF